MNSLFEENEYAISPFARLGGTLVD
jgi:hypothetical protein